MARKGSKKGSGKPLEKIEVSLDISPQQAEELMDTLQERFQDNPERHRGIEWDDVQQRLEAEPRKVASLYAMEATGGEPDVIGQDEETGEYLFCDCSAQSPAGRRSICYDGEAQAEREKKGVYPAGNAADLASEMGIELLTEAQYHALQELGEFDTTTSSWLQTPAGVRERGGAIFGDYRFGRTFVYHNGAPSFYSARGFRGMLRL